MADWAKMLTTNSDKWSTPPHIFHDLDGKFHFTLDPAASDENHLCEKYYTEEQDGLKQDWQGETVFCNPPYCRHTSEWVKKCYEESQKPGTIVVALVPARTDTAWYHDYIKDKASVKFVRGRLRFGGSNQNAPFASMIVLWW